VDAHADVQYRDELKLERHLWRSTGDTAIPPGILDDSEGE
jgi:hypothetical protein